MYKKEYKPRIDTKKEKLPFNKFKKSCVFCKKDLAVEIDYKNIELI